jgi:RNA 2',3'-cyclic 3'-phosphodiesterase
MRLFIALALSAEVENNVAAIQARLQRTEADVRWVEPENFHITVKFLGDLEETHLPDIEAVCEDAAKKSAPFRVRVSGVSFFPKRGPLKTLWAGLSQGGDDWKALVQRMEEPLLPFGAAREGGLVPHITLGRVRSERGIEALRAAIDKEARTDCGEMSVSEIALYQSTLDPRGATYRVLRRWSLRLDAAA